jgi:hypothetical protein
MIKESERKNSATKDVDQIPDRPRQHKYIQVEFEARAKKILRKKFREFENRNSCCS